MDLETKHKELSPIKTFLLQAFIQGLTTYEIPSTAPDFEQHVLGWVENLFDPYDSAKDAQKLQILSWQLGICMAIDLRSHTQSVHGYLSILEYLNFSDFYAETSDESSSKLPHLFFEQAVTAHDLAWCSFYPETHEEIPFQYVRVSSLFAYLRYLLRTEQSQLNGLEDNIKRFGREYIDFRVIDRLLNKRKQLTPIEIQQWLPDVMTYLNLPTDKAPVSMDFESMTTKPDFRGGGAAQLNWLLPYQEFKDLLDQKIHDTDSTEADISLYALGRPLKSSETLCKKFQIYLVLPAGTRFTVCQPWSGVASWGGVFPYLSYMKKDGFGRTFNLRTGTPQKNSRLIARERVAGNMKVPAGSFTSLLSDEPKGQKYIREAVLEEALLRLKDAMNLPGVAFIISR